MSAADPRIAEILDFWFGEPGSSERGRAREVWFRKDAAFDDMIRVRFGAVIDEAAAGGLAGWETGDVSALALRVGTTRGPL